MQDSDETTVWRDVTAELLPEGISHEEILESFNAQFGVGGMAPKSIDGVKVQMHTPSQLAFEFAEEQIVKIWAPSQVPEHDISRWKAVVTEDTEDLGTRQATAVLLGGLPVRFRWECPASGICIFPAPDAAPSQRELAAQHPYMLSYSFIEAASSIVSTSRNTRALERWALLLNGTTYLRCNHTIRSQKAWCWDPSFGNDSRWISCEYRSAAVQDEAAIESAARTRAGEFTDPTGYYYGWLSENDGEATLPESLDQTLAAIDSLSTEDQQTVLQACNLIRAADFISQIHLSTAFTTLVSSVETLAKASHPNYGPTRRFKSLLGEMLASNVEATKLADELYRVRSCILHGDGVFPLDRKLGSWTGSGTELSYCFWLSRSARVATVNWIRSNAGIPLI